MLHSIVAHPLGVAAAAPLAPGATWPPPPPKVKAIAAAAPKKKEVEESAEEKAARELEAMKKSLNRTGLLLAVGGALCLALGAVAPPSFMQHLMWRWSGAHRKG